MHRKTSSIKRLRQRAHLSATHLAAIVTTSVLAAGAIAGCGSSEPVCQGAAQTNVLVISTSRGDLAVDHAMAPQVAREVVQRTASSCGRLLVGLADNHPEADLALRSMRFTPREPTAYNRRPDVARMTAAGTTFVQKHLLRPLKTAKPSPNEAVLGALVAVGNELRVQGIRRADVILVGNGIEDEPAPNGHGIVNFAASATGPRDAATDLARGAASFEPLLGNLAGSCVMLVGAGAGSNLSDAQILSAQSQLQETLEAANVGVAITRSPDMPSECKATAKLRIEEKPHKVIGTLASDLAFQLGSATLQPSAIQSLQRLVPAVRKATRVRVSGYTDSTGTEAINGPLSVSRARSVARWIAAHTGFPIARMKIHGHGSANPIASNASAQGRARNRRVVISITTG